MIIIKLLLRSTMRPNNKQLYSDTIIYKEAASLRDKMRGKCEAQKNGEVTKRDFFE